jgi:hypothetical protein
LQQGRNYRYNLLARWKENGKAVEQTRSILVTAGATVRVSFLDKPKADAAPEKGKDQEVVTSKATKRTRATSINFRKAFGLPFDTLGTLGARIESARRKPDPIALAHAANELAVAEKVSKKKASLTSTAGPAAPPVRGAEGPLPNEATGGRRGDQRRLLEHADRDRR